MTQTPESPSATIRRAAALWRSRAEAATEGPWRAVTASWLGETYSAVIAEDGIPADPSTWLMAGGVNQASRKADAGYAASVHPLVGLDVAALLDAAAQWWDEGTERPEVLTVARRFLGLADAQPQSTGEVPR